ncbi:DUF397 domain-containing protein [Actinomadura craniellae]|uniref:DUF397 domain-containing protein n=1 Tax=Actinomadura craniellae TaxID=2231787 RepID=A0A365GVN9_9ACTN|nr:DUF397 domain-containing protein [Actinomadura craniellae]RAY10876.1 DUF397 domain-containing protein [Actinomadura craniellae]
MNRSLSFEAAVWRRSCHSQGQSDDCVELADLGAAVAIRDSKDPDGPHLTFTPAAVRAFATRIRAGEHLPS